MAIEDLKKDTGKESIFFLKLDLADLVSVKAAAEEFIGKETELHTLYNNGYACVLPPRQTRIDSCVSGVMYTPIDQVTQQGFDMQFGTNVLGMQ